MNFEYISENAVFTLKRDDFHIKDFRVRSNFRVMDNKNSVLPRLHSQIEHVKIEKKKSPP